MWFPCWVGSYSSNKIEASISAISKVCRIDRLELTAISAQISYIVTFKSMLQLKSEINEKVDDVTCWEYIQQTITTNNSSI